MTGLFPDFKSPLKTLDFAVNDELKILICLTCQHALVPTASAALRHFKEKHCDRGTTVRKRYPGLKEGLEKELENYTFAPPMDVKGQHHNERPVPGIKVSRGFHCPLRLQADGHQCSYVAGKESTMETHIKIAHQDSPSLASLRDIEKYPCDYQTLFTGKHRSLFMVKTGLGSRVPRPGGPQDPYLAFIRQIDLASLPAYHPEPIKDDELPSFLRATRWHVFLEPYRRDPKDVAALIRHPTARLAKAMKEDSVEMALCKLSDVSAAWIDQVHKYHRDTSDYVLRILARSTM